MKRFQARDDAEKGEFAVESVRLIDAQTRSFIAKTIIVCGMIALMLTAVFFAIRSDDARLGATVSVIANLLSFVLGRYFSKGT
jgi:hypothetical protein